MRGKCLMETDHQTNRASQPGEDPAAGKPGGPARGTAFQVAGLLLALVSVSAATGFLLWRRAPEVVPPGEAESDVIKPLPINLFRDWPSRVPDLALVLSGQEHG